MSELLGQGEEFAALLAAAHALRLPHALVFEGAPGTGKTTAAFALAEALLAGPDDAAARKQVRARSHLDLHLLGVREGKVEIKVEDVRELQAALAAHSYGGRARVAIIDPGDRLNEEGQNALLKTLEEPGAATFLLLTASRPEGLLPTVRSRVMRYRLRPLAEADLAAALAATRPDAAPDLRTWAVELAAGALGFAQDLVDDPAARPLHARLLAVVEGRDDDVHGIVDACLDDVTGRDAERARARLVLRLLRAILRREVALAHAGGAAYGSAALDRWIESCERTFEAEIDLHQHVPAAQVLLGLLLDLVAPV